MTPASVEPALLPPPKRCELSGRRVPMSEVRRVVEPGHRPEGYRLEVSAQEIRIRASTPEGLGRAGATLAQLTDQDSVAEAQISDWPDLAVRGLMLDISRDKVPTRSTLERLVDLMAAVKLNHLQLYTEHTFAYEGHEPVWRRASPITRSELEDLESYCSARGVELSANQNCLGHMERWLCHDRYRAMAITPHPYPDARGRLRYPSTLDPGRPAALELVRGLLAQLLSVVPSPRVNVGLDEPWELPPERAGDYGAYVSALRAAPELDGREMLMWGDIVAAHPELVGSLPAGVTVLDWGYEANHPFAGRGRVLAEAGRAFWVCPGTSSWNSFLGRWSNARENCLNAGRAATDTGASGFLITDWGDHGHLQPLSISLPGLVAGAAAAWNAAGAGSVDFGRALAQISLEGDAGLGADRAAALLVLGDAHRAVVPQTPNMVSVLLHILYPRLRVGRGSTEGLDQAQLDAYEARLDEGAGRLRAGGADSDLLNREISLVVDLARLGAADARSRLEGDGSLASVSRPDLDALAHRAEDLAARHRDLWTARNRPGGRDDSVERLTHLVRCYRDGVATDFVPAWLRPDG